MATRQEIEAKIKDIKEVLDTLPEAFRGDLKQQLSIAEEELKVIEEQERRNSQPAPAQEPDPEPIPAPVPDIPEPQPTPTPEPQPNIESGDSMNPNAILAALRSMMSMNQGSGLDDAQVRSLIESILRDNKININQLDKSVLDEIRKNQITVLELPNFGGLKIEVSKDDEDIPYFYEILDDVLAGNNVYLIGEAGGGKTFSAEQIAKKLKRPISIINCSQYTSPTEVVGGQTIEGYKDGKLIEAWRDGKMLILDEMPRLDPNTAGLFNDALAKSSKTRKPDDAMINSTNPSEPPVKRNDNFCLIATGNVYPNTTPPSQYKANNQQDLSLLDRFSGSVYKVEYSKKLDEKVARFDFLYKMLVGNYYEYMDAVKQNRTKPTAIGLRTILKELNLDELAVVSYRTLVSFRVAFEFELVRAIARNEGKDVPARGKTLNKAYESFLVAFNQQSKTNILQKTGFTESYIKEQVDKAIKKIVGGDFAGQLTPVLRENASGIYKRYADLFVAQTVKV